MHGLWQRLALPLVVLPVHRSSSIMAVTDHNPTSWGNATVCFLMCLQPVT